MSNFKIRGARIEDLPEIGEVVGEWQDHTDSTIEQIRGETPMAIFCGGKLGKED